MDTLTLLLLALALAMDAFAVAVATGVRLGKLSFPPVFRMAGAFGFFQFLMPVIGWFLGLTVRDLISTWDHWVGFGLLAFVGIGMLREALSKDDSEEKHEGDSTRGMALFMLAIATSIDALAVGISLAMTQVNVAATALVIGTITFVISLLGVRLGKRVGQGIQQRAGLVGGLILIGIGVKILVEHLIG